MLKYIFISVMLLPSLLFAQQREGHAKNHEQIESQRIAYITSKLNLTANEAKLFWPIYDGFKEKKDALQRPSMKDKDFDSISEEEAQSLLNELMAYEEEKLALKKALYADLSNEFSASRLLALLKAEHTFKKKMFDKVKKRRRS